jgi:phospholipase C
MIVARDCFFKCSIKAEVRRIGPSKFVVIVDVRSCSSIFPAASSINMIPASALLVGRNNQDIRAGEYFLDQIYNALVTSPNWSSTVLVINYDEWGGFFDHVAPPLAPVPTATRAAGVAEGINVNNPLFGLLGFRTPNLIVSPFARRGYVSHEYFDHTSVLRMIEWRFGLQPLTVRDQTANNLADVLDFAHPNVSFNVYPVPAAVSAPCLAAPVGSSAEDEFSTLRQYAQSLGFLTP